MNGAAVVSRVFLRSGHDVARIVTTAILLLAAASKLRQLAAEPFPEAASLLPLGPQSPYNPICGSLVL
jgi:hypothetical protein